MITIFSKVLVTLIDVFLILYISVPATSATPAPSLAPRALDVRQSPVDPHGCLPPYTWQRRECVGTRAGGTVVSRAWVDVCRETGTTKYENKQGICDVYNYCLDTYSGSSGRAITCVPLKNSSGQRKTDPQTGSSNPKTAPGNVVFHTTYPVQIDHAMTAASVSAVFKGECHTVNVHFLCSSQDSIEFRC